MMLGDGGLRGGAVGVESYALLNGITSVSRGGSEAR